MGGQHHQVELFGAAGLAQAFQRAQLPRTGGGILQVDAHLHQAHGSIGPAGHDIHLLPVRGESIAEAAAASIE
jgi:hypothetical protein